ncbi:GNAT family N-acetyltransferase [Lyngbya aestuarii]|uniref:GNAT family N-acetyltransferase n=1 Tax=Lyngbya aestuarii TaxID=118322 RepID=UPI00403DF98C
MLTASNVNFRESTPQEDSLVAQHSYQLWRDNQVPAHSIRSDWLEVMLQFIADARRELYYQAFVAEVDSFIVGSVSCQLFAGLYPLALTAKYRKYGYIWNVYVESPYRGQGLAKKLTRTACNYLKSLCCTQVILHASPFGRPVYERLGFVDSNEMRLDLI